MPINTELLMSKLFQWKTSLVIEDVPFYIRVVSDQVIEDARKISLLEARKLRRQLRDETTDDYLIHIDPLLDLDDEELRELLLTYGMQEIMRNYMQTTPRVVLPSLGDNPTQVEQEEFEAAKEAQDKEYLEQLQEYVKAWRTEYEETLMKRERSTLFSMARNARVDQICQDLFSTLFEEYVVAASVYTDDKYKTRAFTLEQYKMLPRAIKQKFLDAYNNMTIPADDIKN